MNPHAQDVPNPPSASFFPEEYNPNDYFLHEDNQLLLTPLYPLKPLFQKIYLKNQSQTGQIQKELQNHNNPYLCAIHKVYYHHKKIIIIMEHCPKNLKQIKPNHPLFIEKLLQISKGVQYLHGRGIIHLDLKPHNVMISEEGTAKIIDFNISKKAVEGGTLVSSNTGTIGYIPPEITSPDISQIRVDYSADIWSLGALIYRLLANQSFDLPQITEIQVRAQIQKLSCSEDLKSLLKGMLQVDPTKRLSIGQVVGQLQKIKWREDLFAANYTGTLHQRRDGIAVHAFVIQRNTVLAFLKRDWFENIKQWQFTILNRTYRLSEAASINNLKYWEYEGALITVENESSAQQKPTSESQIMNNPLDQYYPLLFASDLFTNSHQHRLYLGKQFLEKVTSRQQGQLTYSSRLSEDNFIPGRPVIAESAGRRSVVGIFTGWFNIWNEPVMLLLPETMKGHFRDPTPKQSVQLPRIQRPESKNSVISKGESVNEAIINPSFKLNQKNSSIYSTHCKHDQASEVINQQSQISSEAKSAGMKAKCSKCKLAEILNANQAIIFAKEVILRAELAEDNNLKSQYEKALSVFDGKDPDYTRHLNILLGHSTKSLQIQRMVVRELKNQIQEQKIFSMKLINLQIDSIVPGREGIPKLRELIQNSVRFLRQERQSSDSFWVLNCLYTINQLIRMIAQLFWVTINQCLQEGLGRKELRYHYPEQLKNYYDQLPDKDAFHDKESIKDLREIKQTLIQLNNLEFSCRFGKQVNYFLNRVAHIEGLHSQIANTLLDK